MPILNRPAQFFGNQHTTRKVLNAFMDFLSDNLFVERLDLDGNIYRYIQVPVQYAHREYYMAMLRAAHQNTNMGDQTNVLDLNRLLPRISINMTTMTYNGERKMANRNEVIAETYNGTDGTVKTLPAGTPYNLELEATIITKTQDDIYQIIEQILPYFGPTHSIYCNLIEDFEPQELPFTLVSIIPDTNDEFGVDEGRIFLTTLVFSVPVIYYYIKQDTGYIKRIIADFHLGKSDTSDDYLRFKEYVMDPLSPVPTTEIGNRENEPVDETWIDFIEDDHFLITQDGSFLITEDGDFLLTE